MFPGVLREVTTHFIVDARALTKVGGNHVKARIVSPSGTATDGYTTDKGDGTYRVEYTPFEDGRDRERGGGGVIQRQKMTYPRTGLFGSCAASQSYACPQQTAHNNLARHTEAG